MHRYLAVVAFTLGGVWVLFLTPGIGDYAGFWCLLAGFGVAIAAFIIERRRRGRMGLAAGALLFNAALFALAVPAVWYLANIYQPSAVDFISVGFVVVLWGASMCVVIALASRRG